MVKTSHKEMLEAGVHFGHLKRKRNPNMTPYIFMERNGIHIIDLNKSLAKLEDAAAALKQVAKSGRKILFIGVASFHSQPRSYLTLGMSTYTLMT